MKQALKFFEHYSRLTTLLKEGNPKAAPPKGEKKGKKDGEAGKASFSLAAVFVFSSFFSPVGRPGAARRRSWRTVPRRAPTCSRAPAWPSSSTPPCRRTTRTPATDPRPRRSWRCCATRATSTSTYSRSSKPTSAGCVLLGLRACTTAESAFAVDERGGKPPAGPGHLPAPHTSAPERCPAAGRPGPPPSLVILASDLMSCPSKRRAFLCCVASRSSSSTPRPRPPRTMSRTLSARRVFCPYLPRPRLTLPTG